MDEIWKDIPGFEGIYQASNHGNVKRISVAKGGKIKMLSPSKNQCGYLDFSLYKNYKRTHLRAHRLVALLFIDNPENLTEVNHKNGVKTDNHFSNLEWVSHSENNLHAFRIGLRSHKGDNHNRRKLSYADVVRIREMSKNEGLNHRQIAKIYNVHSTTICDIVNLRSWV